MNIQAATGIDLLVIIGALVVVALALLLFLRGR